MLRNLVAHFLFLAQVFQAVFLGLDACVFFGHTLSCAVARTLLHAVDLTEVADLLFELVDLFVQRGGEGAVVADFLALFERGGEVLLNVCNLRCGRGGAAHAQHGVPRFFGGAFHGAPGALDVAHAGQHLGAAALQGAVVGVLRQGGSFGLLAKVHGGLNLFVSAGRQVVHRLVELGRCAHGVFAQVGKVFGDVFGGGAEGFFGHDGRLGKVLQAGPAHLSGGCKLGQHFGGFAGGGAKALIHGRGHGGELVGAGTGGVAGGDQGGAESVGLFAALVVGHGHSTGGGGSHGEGVDQAGHVTAQGLGGVACAAKHVFELTALLQKHGQRGLPACQAGGNVGELRGHATQGGGGLFGADARLGLLGLDGFELVDVGLQRGDVYAALLGQGLEVLGGAALTRLQRGCGALHAGDHAFGGVVQLLGGRGCAVGNAVDGFARLVAVFGHAVAHAAASLFHALKRLLGRGRVGADF